MLKSETSKSKPVLNPIDRLLASLAELRRRQSSKSAHFFRTSLRRFQAWTEAVEIHPHGKEKKILGFLERLRKESGKLRDAEVQRDLLQALRVRGSSREKSRVMSALRRESTRRARKLRVLVGNGRLEKLDILLAQWLPRYASSLAASRHEMLEKAWQDYAAFVAIRPELSDATLHDYRLACKQFRYTAELAGDAPDAARAIAGWKQVQDAIGDWHDWVVLHEVAVETLTAAEKSPVAMAIERRAEQGMAQAKQAAEHLERTLLKRSGATSVSSSEVQVSKKAKQISHR